MKVTIVYDNEVYLEGLKADWGLSCLIEAEGIPRILFDTGAKGSILLHNMEQLNIDPLSIDEVFISHAHWDHMGGLADFLKINNRVKIYMPLSAAKGATHANTIGVGAPMQLHENVYSTGELQGIEQSLVISTLQGLVVIVGCSHPGVDKILKAASGWGNVYAIIGGLHGFHDFGLFKGLGRVCPCHCTQFKREIEKLFTNMYNSGGAGRVILL